MTKSFFGLFLWFLACFLPSLLTSYLESKALNGIPGFYRSPVDTFEIALVLTLITAVYTLPIVFFIRMKTKKPRPEKKDIYQVYGFIFSYGSLVFAFHLYLTVSIIEAVYITIPCLLLFLIFSAIFMKRNTI